MIKYFAISDIHSFYNPMIEALLAKGFEQDNPDHKIILCGDLLDRGDDSVKVVEFCKNLAKQNRLIYVLGNHEDLFFTCLEELSLGKTPNMHHYHNGTVKSICMLCGQSEWISYFPDGSMQQLIKEKTADFRDFVNKYGVNYFCLGNKIFVHSWLPTNLLTGALYENWDADPNTLSIDELDTYTTLWKKARWGNPFEQKPIDGKCIVFGHWHTSWYWSHIKQTKKEWPQKNKDNWLESFEPVISENIIGLDSCVAYSGKINCVVFDEDGNIIS